jgi:hypothetical protein
MIAITTDTKANKLIAEALGLCWHQGFTVNGNKYACQRCGSHNTANPDWTSDARESLELVPLLPLSWTIEGDTEGWQVVDITQEGKIESVTIEDMTFEHAICSAYLKSKGVEHSWEVPSE